LSGSEEALARLSIERLTAPSPHVLIGGLGMGFTLRAALAALGDKGMVTVAELIPAVVAWARGPMTGIFAGCLDDPRVRVAEADVRVLIDEARGAYDAILLDVDNGPEGLTVDSNDALYSLAGLAETHRALRPGGVLAVWSSGPGCRVFPPAESSWLSRRRGQHPRPWQSWRASCHLDCAKTRNALNIVRLAQAARASDPVIPQF
jgi:spermidine synthase